MRTDFYVYEHWRPDLDLCFWVGKGTGDRAYRFKRNRGYDDVIVHLSSLGMCAEVRLVASGLSERRALLVECERIAFWRSSSVCLTNRTNGGDGNRGLFVSEETRIKLRLANLGKRHSAETRLKMSKAHKNSGRAAKGRAAGFRHSPETRKKMADAQIGKTLSETTKQKLRLANLGKTHSAETREKMGVSRLGNTNGRGGKGLRRSDETKKRMSEAQKKQREVAE